MFEFFQVLNTKGGRRNLAKVSGSSLHSLVQQLECFSIGEMDTSSGPGDLNHVFCLLRESALFVNL